ncbi:hypothetical protein WJX81_005711 [Elliptochloris bilobata]|uniref:SEC7 domain-containing protein n=1 Tax=Elliptochloris bilobata TaxID=381761 RepID=A0AAW1S3P8_9CHLO
MEPGRAAPAAQSASWQQEHPELASGEGSGHGLGSWAGSEAGSGGSRLHRVTPMPGVFSANSSPRSSQRLVAALPSLSEAEYQAARGTSLPSLSEAGSDKDEAPTPLSSTPSAELGPAMAERGLGSGSSGGVNLQRGAGALAGGPAVAGSGPGVPAAAVARQFWLSAEAAAPEGGGGVASHQVKLRGIPGQNGDYMLMSPSPSPSPSPALTPQGAAAAPGVARPPQHTRSASGGGGSGVGPDAAGSGARVGFVTPAASPRESGAPWPAPGGSPAALARAAEVAERLSETQMQEADDRRASSPVQQRSQRAAAAAAFPQDAKQMMAQLAGDVRAGSPRSSSAAVPAAPLEPSVLDPGLGFVREEDASDEVAVARFMRSTPGLPRQLVGDLLGEVEPRCLRVLDAFTRSFDFGGMPFEDAIRLYLESFRLPGEAQKIYRIMDSWSQHYFAQCPGSFANADAVHVLAFSVIILNTDQHNTTVKRKMTAEEFVHNNRGINAGASLPAPFLRALYASIVARPIRMPASSALAAQAAREDRNGSPNSSSALPRILSRGAVPPPATKRRSGLLALLGCGGGGSVKP